MRNPESEEMLLVESGIQIKESGIPITIGIQNSTVLQKNTGIQYLESGIHSVEFRIQDCAGLFPYMGWRMSIYNYIHTEIYSLKSYDVNFLITWIFEPQALSSTNYFSMSILRRSVTVGEIILFIDVSLAWDQAPPWGKRRKKSASEASREEVWEGKGWRRPLPFPRSPLSSLLLPIFFLFDPVFFSFFPHCGAWSQVSGSYATKLEKLPLNDKITASCLQNNIVNYKQQKGTLKNC